MDVFYHAPPIYRVQNAEMRKKSFFCDVITSVPYSPQCFVPKMLFELSHLKFALPLLKILEFEKSQGVSHSRCRKHFRNVPNPDKIYMKKENKAFEMTFQLELEEIDTIL